MLQVSAQVIGNDTAITVGGLQGQFELNVRIPLIARNLLQSIALLANASELFAEKCVEGIEANLAGCEASAEGTLAVATALNPFIGYDKAAEIVKDAAASGRTLREVAREHGVDEATLDAALDLRKIAAGSSSRRMSTVGTDADLLERIEAYFDATPRAAADVEEHGALTLFVRASRGGSTGGRGWGWRGRRGRRRRRGARAPARARGARGVRVGARDDAVARRRGGGGRAARCAGAAAGARRGGLGAAAPPAGVALRMLGADDRALPAAQAAVELAFAAEGMGLGEAGPGRARDLADRGARRPRASCASAYAPG